MPNTMIGLRTLAVLNLAAFLAMVAVNALANILPINGLNTGAISDSYPNLFVPAGFTFSIWGVIYLLLGAFAVYQLALGFGGAGVAGPGGVAATTATATTATATTATATTATATTATATTATATTTAGPAAADLVSRVGIWFVLSAMANIAWVFAWHYQRIALSLLAMLVLLGALITIYLRLAIGKGTPVFNPLFVSIPFSVYLGWITVATVANVTALLVERGWSGWGIAEGTWAAGVIVVAAVLAVLMLQRHRDIAFALVVVWALYGIYAKRVATDPLQTRSVIVAAAICGVVLVLLIGVTAVRGLGVRRG